MSDTPAPSTIPPPIPSAARAVRGRRPSSLVVSPAATAPGPIRVVTNCSTRDEFLLRFARFVDETSIFVITPAPLPIGTARPFACQLDDGSVVLAGRCRVADAFTRGDGPGGLSGMRLAFVELAPGTAEVHRALLDTQAHWSARRAAASPRAAASRPPTLPPFPPPARQIPRPAPIVPVHDPFGDLPDAPSRRAASPPWPIAIEGPMETGQLPRGLPSLAHYASGADATVRVAPLIDAPAPRSRRPLAALALAAAIAGIGGGYVIASGSDRTAIAASAPRPAAGPGVLAAALAAPAQRAREAVPPPAPPAPEPVAAVAPTPTCVAHVLTEPAGAAVRWGEIDLGETPLDQVPVPCGAARVVLARAGYVPLGRPVIAAPDAPTVIDVGLARPNARLRLRSVPPGAVFTIDGAVVGRPAAAPVRAYSHVEVTATLPGRKPWTRRVFVRGRRDAVLARLGAAGR